MVRGESQLRSATLLNLLFSKVANNDSEMLKRCDASERPHRMASCATREVALQTLCQEGNVAGIKARATICGVADAALY